jgi:hypothetical protein
VLDLTIEQINGAQVAPNDVADDDALHVVGYFGDADGNATYTSNDSQLIARAAAGLDAGFSAWPTVDPLVVGDTSQDGRISATDASLVATMALGRTTVTIPPIPNGINIVFAGASGTGSSPAALETTTNTAVQPSGITNPELAIATTLAPMTANLGRDDGGSGSALPTPLVNLAARPPSVTHTPILSPAAWQVGFVTTTTAGGNQQSMRNTNTTLRVVPKVNLPVTPSISA